jgi:uncharacterized membrane protein
MRIVLGSFFIIAGGFHFLHTSSYVLIIPHDLPFRFLAVYFSGAAEITLGVLLVIDKQRKLAAWGTILLIISLLPINIYIEKAGIVPDIPWLNWGRIPILIVLMGLSWWQTTD